MTFTDLVTAVQDRLNLTSAASTARIGRELNDRYKRVTSSISLDLSRRTVVTATTTIGVRNLTFNNIEKILSVYDTSSGRDRVLGEVTYDELRNTGLGSAPPQRYAIASVAAQSVTIYLDLSPATVFTLTADGYALAATLAGTQTPAFSESFHDILMHGVIADELRKLEKFELAREAEDLYERRLGELRYFLAKSSYLQIFQGGRGLAPGGGGGGSGASVPGSILVSTLLGTANRLVTLDSAGQGVATFTTDGVINTAFTTAAVGNIDDLNFGGAALIRMTNPTLATLRGLVAGTAGQRVTIVSAGAGQVDLAHQNVGSVAANRLLNIATSGNTSLKTDSGSATYIYDGTTARWRLVAHEQGAWITSAFAAGDYTATTGAWTVTAGNVSAAAYLLRGRTVFVKVAVTSTSVSAVTANLFRAIPGGFTTSTSQLNVFQPMRAIDNGAVGVWALAHSNGQASITFWANANGGGWAISTNNTTVEGSWEFEVT